VVREEIQPGGVVSDLSNKKPVLTESLDVAAGVGTDEQAKVRPVTVWAAVGGALLALQIYVWVRWMTGPWFHHVPSGPGDPPLYMKIPLVANGAASWILLPLCVWFLIIRPWRQERRFTLDGMLLVSCGLMFFQDPLLNYFNNWSTYNTWNFNMGSWTQEIPGWVSPEVPGHQAAEPLLTNTPGYFLNVLFIILGCFIMRKVKARWPGVSNLKLIGIVYAANIVIDFIMEGLIMLPIGFYIYPGSIRAVSINAGTYYQWPIYEGLMWGGVLTALTCLRYFTDDRGRTVVERGLDRVRGGFAKQQFVRFLAIFAAVSACFFVFYNLPAQWFAMHSDPWPEDVMKRSYFLGGFCGDGTPTPCPNPILPIPTKGSGFIDNNGHLVLPDGAQVPPVIPLDGK
jgi:hypothetical protein